MPSPCDSCQDTCGDGKGSCGKDCKCGDDCKCAKNKDNKCGCNTTKTTPAVGDKKDD